MQEITNGCNALEEHLKVVCQSLECSHDVRGRNLSVSSPTRARRQSASGVPDDSGSVTETPRRMQAEALLLEWHERLVQEKEQLAEAIQLLSSSVITVRVLQM